MTRSHLITAAIILALIAACVIIMTYESPDLVQERFEHVRLGMTQDEVEQVMDAAPGLAIWKGMDVFIFEGRTGIAEVQIDMQTRRVIRKRWSPQQRN